MQKVERNSNFELLRLISMLFIVIYHILVHGKILEHASGTCEILLVFIESILLVHVNSYILLSGYFQSENDFKMSKILKINNMVWFYKVVIMFVFVFLQIVPKPDIITRIHTYLPIDYGIYWFIECYLILYMISPLLNKVINNSDKNNLRRTIIILFIIISILSTFTKDIFINTTTGRSLSTFILLYFIGAYIKKYPIDFSYYMKPFTKQAKRLIYIFIFFFCAILSTFCWISYNHFESLGNMAQELGSILGFLHISYASPIVIFQSIAYVLFFNTLNFKSKFINKMASCSLAIYLISENIYVRETIYDKMGITQLASVTPNIILKVLVISLIIYILCIIIEIIRKTIFNFIYNSKLAKKIRYCYRKYIEELGIKINW